MTSGLTSRAASPARAIATSVPFGVAPLAAVWNAMLARVGSSGPAEVTIRRPGTGTSMKSYRPTGAARHLPTGWGGETDPSRWRSAAAALAGWRRPPADHARRASADPAHPPRAAPRRKGGRRPRLAAGAAARGGRRPRCAAHRQAWRARRVGGGPGLHRGFRSGAGIRPEPLRAVHRDIPDGRRHRCEPTGVSVLGR